MNSLSELVLPSRDLDSSYPDLQDMMSLQLSCPVKINQENIVTFVDDVDRSKIAVEKSFLEEGQHKFPQQFFPM